MPKAPRPVFIAALLAGLALAMIVVWPQGVGIHRLPFIANAIALRGVLALGVAIAALLVGALAAWRRRGGAVAVLAIALAAVAVGNGAVLLGRSMMPPAQDARTGGELTVVSWNAYGGGASPESIARLIRETGADVVALPETDAFAAARIAGLLAEEGVSMRHDTIAAAPGGESIPSSLLVSSALGAYERDTTVASTPGLPSAVWRPVEGGGPTVVVAHPMPPLADVVDQWEAGLRWIAARCTERDVIVAGDLNATIDHFAGLGLDGADIGGCRDAAAQHGRAGAATWPVWLPVALGAPIDHVLAGSAWRVTRFDVRGDMDDAGSDHRPIVAPLVRR